MTDANTLLSMDSPILWLVAAVFLYPLLQATALKMTEQTRLQLADAGRSLLSDPTVSEEHKVFISEMLDDVFDWRFMALASFNFPRVVLFGRPGHRLTLDERTFLCREDVSDFFRLHFRAVLATSVFFSVIFFVVAALTFVVILIAFGMTMLNVIWADTVKQVSPVTGHRAEDVAFK